MEPITYGAESPSSHGFVLIMVQLWTTTGGHSVLDWCMARVCSLVGNAIKVLARQVVLPSMLSLEWPARRCNFDATANLHGL